MKRTMHTYLTYRHPEIPGIPGGRPDASFVPVHNSPPPTPTPLYPLHTPLRPPRPIPGSLSSCEPAKTLSPP